MPIRPALRIIPTFWLTYGLHVLTLLLLVQNTFPERPARLTWFLSARLSHPAGVAALRHECRTCHSKPKTRKAICGAGPQATFGLAATLKGYPHVPHSQSESAWFYADRATRRHRHHRRADRTASPRCAKGPGSGQPNPVYQ